MQKYNIEFRDEVVLPFTGNTFFHRLARHAIARERRSLMPWLKLRTEQKTNEEGKVIRKRGGVTKVVFDPTIHVRKPKCENEDPKESALLSRFRNFAKQNGHLHFHDLTDIEAILNESSPIVNTCDSPLESSPFRSSVGINDTFITNLITPSASKVVEVEAPSSTNKEVPGTEEEEEVSMSNQFDDETEEILQEGFMCKECNLDLETNHYEEAYFKRIYGDVS
mgnify:CR=1 FL=1